MWLCSVARDCLVLICGLPALSVLSCRTLGGKADRTLCKQAGPTIQSTKARDGTRLKNSTPPHPPPGVPHARFDSPKIRWILALSHFVFASAIWCGQPGSFSLQS